LEGIAGLSWCVESKAKRGSFLDHVLYLHIMFKDFGERYSLFKNILFFKKIQLYHKNKLNLKHPTIGEFERQPVAEKPLDYLEASRLLENMVFVIF